MTCAVCHVVAEKASLPGKTVCGSCHEDVAEVRPARVYRLADFVIFSHARHSKAGCAVCHGDVMTMEKVVRHRPLTMKACVDCHRAEKATVACSVCHEVTQ